jgi:hypothetical protein
MLKACLSSSSKTSQPGKPMVKLLVRDQNPGAQQDTRVNHEVQSLESLDLWCPGSWRRVHCSSHKGRLSCLLHFSPSMFPFCTSQLDGVYSHRRDLSLLVHSHTHLSGTPSLHMSFIQSSQHLNQRAQCHLFLPMAGCHREAWDGFIGVHVSQWQW